MEEVKILIVEDDLSFASVLQDQLTLIGFQSYNLVSVDSIAETRLVKEEFEPDVVLLDLNIRDSFGIETYHQVHALFEESTIVVLSGLDDKKLALQIVSSGAQDYLLKTGINSAVLEKTINYGMLRRSSRLQLAESEKKYKDLFFQSPLPMLNLVGENLDIVFCNPAALQLYEAEEAQLVGKSMHDFTLEPVTGAQKQAVFTQTTQKGNKLNTSITLNQLQENTRAYIALVVDKTEEIQFENLKYNLVSQAEEREKKNIARELHDGLGQQLTLLNLLFQTVNETEENKETMETIRQVIQSSIREVKEMAYSLLPPELDKGLLNGLDRLAHRMNSTGKINFTFECSKDIDEASFFNTDRFHLYRIIQEATNNAMKHANATDIKLSISMEDKQCIIVISDNGVGFDLESNRAGIGLQSMEHRMNMAGIRGKVTSELGKGTSVELRIES